MQYSTARTVKTRKPHQCDSCKNIIPVVSTCLWFKSVSFHDSETGHQWHEGWLCSACDMKTDEEGAAPNA